MTVDYGSGGGGGGTVDGLARAGIAALTATSGVAIPVNGWRFSDGFEWTNNTAAPIVVPNPADAAGMLAAGFTQGNEQSTTQIRYTTNGIIQDKDHRAILDGVTSMTVAATTTERRISLYNAGTAPVSIVDTTGAQFIVTNPVKPIFTQTSTDSTIVINQSHRDGTLVFDGVAWEFTR